MAASPRRVPTAAPAAKSGPCSRARKTETGAEVRGKPESHPPTPCPQRRATRVATAIRSGGTTSVNLPGARGRQERARRGMVSAMTNWATFDQRLTAERQRIVQGFLELL